MRRLFCCAIPRNVHCRTMLANLNRETGFPAITYTGPRPPDPCDTSTNSITRGPDAKPHGFFARLSLRRTRGHRDQSPAHTAQHHATHRCFACSPVHSFDPTLPCRRPLPPRSLQASGDQHSFLSSTRSASPTDIFPGACLPAPYHGRRQQQQTFELRASSSSSRSIRRATGDSTPPSPALELQPLRCRSRVSKPVHYLACRAS